MIDKLFKKRLDSAEDVDYLIDNELVLMSERLKEFQDSWIIDGWSLVLCYMTVGQGMFDTLPPSNKEIGELSECDQFKDSWRINFIRPRHTTWMNFELEELTELKNQGVLCKIMTEYELNKLSRDQITVVKINPLKFHANSIWLASNIKFAKKWLSANLELKAKFKGCVWAKYGKIWRNCKWAKI